MEKKHVLVEENFEEIRVMMKKAAFWKSAAFGIVCIRQEYEVYEQLAKNRFFDMTKFLKKTVERFWKAAATGYSMDEQYILAVEESFFEPRDGFEELALQFVQDLSDFFYAVAEKNAKRALRMQECQINFIKKYLSLLEKTDEEGQRLLEKALANQLALAIEIEAVPNKEKKAFLNKLCEREADKLLGEDFINNIPAVKKEKPAKKKLSEIRATSLAYDRDSKEKYYTWLLNATKEQWVVGQDVEKECGAYSEYYHNKNFFDLCDVMDTKYRIYADEDYVYNRIPERVRGFWYLSALTTLRAYQLYEKGFPTKFGGPEIYESGKKIENEGFWFMFSTMIYAYASGEDSLLEEIRQFTNEGEGEDTTVLFQLLTGADGKELYSYVEAWDKGDIKDAFLAILREDKKELRKIILKMIRHDRKMYDLNKTMVDPYAYACLRLAKERGMELEPVLAAEVLDGNLDMTPLDKSYWKLPYQDEIDAWLDEHKNDSVQSV